MCAYHSPVLNLSDIPDIALASMNETHREEVEIINQLGVLLEQGMRAEPDNNAIEEKLHQWVEHTRSHFNGENLLMETYEFPAYSIHSGEHKRVLQQIENLQQQWQDTHAIQPLADFIFKEWPLWFDNHVNSMDMMTAQFLSQVMT